MVAALLCRRLVARAPHDVAPLSVRLRVSHLLDTAELRPPGLPPRAVLLIRRLQAARPLPLAGFRADPGWESATRAQLAALHRRAIRPLRGLVPPDAEAVLFADEAEWLAALALAGAPVVAPWWAAPAAAAPGTAPIRPQAAWRAAPRSVPGAIERLVAWRALRTLASWPSGAVAEIEAAIVEAFALPWPKASGSGALAGPTPHPVHATPREHATASPGFPPVAPPPACAALREAAGWQFLPSETRRLAVLAVALAAAPRSLRDRAMPAWIASLSEALPATPVGAHRGAAAAVQQAPAPTVVAASRAPTDVRSPLNSHPLPVAVPSDAARGLPQASLDLAPRIVHAMPPVPAPGADATSTAAGPEEGVATRLGGLFLLLDLVLRAGLPAALDATHDLSRYLTGWTILEWLGRALLGDAEPEEPVWATLARLDGRAPDEPVPALPARDLAIPPAWLPPDDAAWRAVAARGRLRLLHPDGDVILDRAVGPISAEAALAEARATLGDRVPRQITSAADAPQLHGAWLHALPSGTARLAGCVVSCLLAQAARRLGSAPRDAAAELRAIATRPARLYVAPAHLDVVFALADLSLAARRAGLDADPGWVPDLMRVVRFHFR